LYICLIKSQLPYCNTSDAIKGYSDSPIAKSEKNDCVVRAIASAFDLEYDIAHKFVADKFGRKPKQGTIGFGVGMNKISDDRTRIGRKCINPMGKKPEYSNFYSLSYNVTVKGKRIKRQMTVGTFISKYPTGTYIITVKGHAFTIKNGVVIGNKGDSIQKRKIIVFAWKVGN
jgi:hypothetical protein